MVMRFLRSILPVTIKHRLRPLYDAFVVARIAADSTSRRRLRALRSAKLGGEGEIVKVALRPLGGIEIGLRRGTTDFDVLLSAFRDEFHLPPASIQRRHSSVFLDLGANIGITMAHLAHGYPNARIIGIELDPAAAALCRQNTMAWSGRCSLIEAAVWTSDGQVSYEIEPGHEWSAHVVRSPGALSQATTVRSISLNSVVSKVAPDALVDYAKMDVEGAERELLRHATEWAARVRTIKVEIHPPYSAEECVDDLRRLGFQVETDTRNRQIVTGHRPRSNRLSSP